MVGILVPLLAMLSLVASSLRSWISKNNSSQGECWIINVTLKGFLRNLQLVE